MPTKARRIKERAKARDNAELERQIAANPKLKARLNLNKAKGAKNPFAGALDGLPRGGLLQADPATGEAVLHDNIGQGGAQCRRDDALDKVTDLRRRFRALWGQRGKAKIIAAEETELLRRQGKKGITERTVQRYFKALK